MAAMYAVQLSFSDDTARLALRPAHRETLAGHAADGPTHPYDDPSSFPKPYLPDDEEPAT